MLSTAHEPFSRLKLCQPRQLLAVQCVAMTRAAPFWSTFPLAVAATS